MTTTQLSSVVTQRAQALLGDAPVLTFHVDGGDHGGCSVRLVRASQATWVGLAADRAYFLERVRLGARPRFAVHLDVDTPTLWGEAHVRIVGRADVPAGLENRTRDLVAALCARDPFGGMDLVVLEVTLAALQLDDGEGVSHGAVPRT